MAILYLEVRRETTSRADCADLPARRQSDHLQRLVGPSLVVLSFVLTMLSGPPTAIPSTFPTPMTSVPSAIWIAMGDSLIRYQTHTGWDT